MCFSANASFGAGAVVAVAGIVSTRKIKNSQQVMFAVIPLLFALQQIMEGWVWITFNNNDYFQWQRIPVTIFLIVAQVVWPIWVPLSILKIEQNSGRRSLLKILFFCSVVFAPIQAYRLFFYPPTVEVNMHHIHYGLDVSIPYLRMILNVFYFMTTIVPPFLSSRKSVLVLGVLNAVALVLSLVSFRPNVVSIWCFFAALISWQVIQTMNAMRDEAKMEAS